MSHFSYLTHSSLGTLIEAAKTGSVSRFIGRSRSEDSVCNAPANQNSNSNSPASDEAVTESPSDSNPSLDKNDVDPHRKRHQSVKHKDHREHKEKEHHHNYHLHFGALAALKRKRKKFSNSRNESPVLEPPPECSSPATSLKTSIKKVIKNSYQIYTHKIYFLSRIKMDQFLMQFLSHFLSQPHRTDFTKSI